MNYKYLLFATLILTSCRGVQYLARQAAPGATYAETIDTKSKPITFQTKNDCGGDDGGTLVIEFQKMQ